jgi:hypothetical protein
MRRLWGVIALFWLLCGCEGEQLYDTQYPVHFTFDTKLHPNSLISRLVENVNYFLIVDSKLSGKTHVLTIESNSGEKETVRIETENENRAINGMGANNSLVIGCLFGYTLEQSSADLYSYVAFDRQCPACLDTYAGTNYPLTWGDTANTLTCAKCKRTYQLLGAGGSSDGHRLKTYHMRYDKTQRVFYVTNM